jgi:hypothetical protein
MAAKQIQTALAILDDKGFHADLKTGKAVGGFRAGRDSTPEQPIRDPVHGVEGGWGFGDKSFVINSAFRTSDYGWIS